jgi:hypothetical protein
MRKVQLTRKYLAALALVFAAAPAAAVAESGNGTDRGGGDALICGEKVYLADTFFLRDTPEMKAFAKLEKQPQGEILGALLQSIRQSDPATAEYLENAIDPARPGASKYVTIEEPKDKHGKPLRRDLRQGGLEELDDDNIVSTPENPIPPGCVKKQLAIQTLKRAARAPEGDGKAESVIRFDELLALRLSKVERVLFWVHEGFIRYRLENEDPAPDTSAIRKRVGLLGSSESFQEFIRAILSFQCENGRIALAWYRAVRDRDLPYLQKYFLSVFSGSLSIDDLDLARKVLADRIVAVGDRSFLRKLGEQLDPAPVKQNELFLIDYRTREPLVRLVFQCVGGGIRGDKSGAILFPILNDKSCSFSSYEVLGTPLAPETPGPQEPTLIRVVPATQAPPGLPEYDRARYQVLMAEVSNASIGPLKDRLDLKVLLLAEKESCTMRRESWEKAPEFGYSVPVPFASFEATVHAREGDPVRQEPLKLGWTDPGCTDLKTGQKTGSVGCRTPGRFQIVPAKGTTPARFETRPTSGTPTEMACFENDLSPGRTRSFSLNFIKWELKLDDLIPELAQPDGTKRMVSGSWGTPDYGRLRGTHLNYFKLGGFGRLSFILTILCSSRGTGETACRLNNSVLENGSGGDPRRASTRYEIRGSSPEDPPEDPDEP